MLTRRQFLVGTSAGMILPTWMVKAENHVENFGEPLIEKPRRVSGLLYAVDWGGDGLQLHFGADPKTEEMPDACWDDPFALHQFVQHDSTSAQAYDMLYSLDLGIQINDSGEEHIKFQDGTAPCNESKVVEARDYVALSLLQHRLNHLDSSIIIRLA